MFFLIGGSKHKEDLIWQKVYAKNQKSGLLTETQNKLSSVLDLNKPHLAWSIGKSLVGIMTSKAIEEERISLTTPVSQFIQSAPKDLQVNHLLFMTSGINYFESASPFFNSGIIQLLWGKAARVGLENFFVDFFSAPNATLFPPGTRFNYSSFDTLLLVYLLKKSYGDQNSAKNSDILDHLLKDLNMRHSYFQKSRDEIPLASSLFYSSPKDLMKLGESLLEAYLKPRSDTSLLRRYLNLLDLHPASTDKLAMIESENPRVYSAHIILNRVSKKTGEREFSSLPEDALIFYGYGGQLLVVLPSERSITLRLASKNLSSFELDRGIRDLQMKSYLPYVRQLSTTQDRKSVV